MKTQLLHLVHRYTLGWIVITLGVIALAMGVTACSDDDPAAEDQDALVGTWTLGTEGEVIKDGTDVTANYAGLQITFVKEGAYTTQHAGALFEASGTWARKDANSVLLDQDFEITVVSATATDLTLYLMFSIDDVSGGRVKSLVGEYTLHLKK
jgi:hypothetical protein